MNLKKKLINNPKYCYKCVIKCVLFKKKTLLWCFYFYTDSSPLSNFPSASIGSLVTKPV